MLPSNFCNRGLIIMLFSSGYVPVCVHCPFSCHWAPLKRACTSLQVLRYSDKNPQSLLLAQHSQPSQPFLGGEVLQTLNHL